MQAIVLRQHGGPDVLRVEDFAKPAIRANEVLVRVRACALNRLDLWIRQNPASARFPLPHILGSDIAGEVEEAGELCSRIQPGMRVLLAPGLSCRQCPACLSGNDNLCPQYAVFGAGVKGGNREYVAAPEYAVLPIPDHLNFVQAAAAPLVFLTAWHMLMTRARLQLGEDVLVLSASSGVGMAAVQIAQLLHCRVIATVGGEEKRKKAQALGVGDVIDHYRQAIDQEVKRLTNGRGVDVVVEHVGAASWAKSLASLAPGGRIVTCGATTGYDVRLDLRYMFSKQQAYLGSYMGTLGELNKVLKFLFNGKLKPVVDRVFPLAEAAAAHAYLESQEQFGKVVFWV